MEPRKRTHLVNALTEEANLMMTVLEKAMEGERHVARTPVMPGTLPPQEASSLEDEHNTWGKILRALTDIQTALHQIEHAEQQRIARSDAQERSTP